MYIMAGASVLSWDSHTPQLASDVFVASGARLIGQLKIGALSSLWFNTVLRGDVNYIEIGEKTNIQDNTTVHVSAKKYPTIIGNEVTIGHNAIIHACTIKDRVLVGMGAVVLDGAVIPERSFVAAGSLVPPHKTYPPGMLLKGSPAEVARPLRPEELAYLAHSADHYVAISTRYYPQASFHKNSVAT